MRLNSSGGWEADLCFIEMLQFHTSVSHLPFICLLFVGVLSLKPEAVLGCGRSFLLEGGDAHILS